MLGLLRLTVVDADQGRQGLGQPDEPHRQGPVLEHLGDGIVRPQVLRTDPDPLPHEEGEVPHQLVGLDLEPVEQLVDDEVDHPVEGGEESIDVVVGLDRQPRQVDRGEGEVPASPGLGPRGVMDVRHHPGAAAHVGDLGLGMAGHVVLGVERGVLEGEVREEALGTHPAGQPEQVVVGVVVVEIDALLHPEDLDREDRGLPAAQTGFGSLQQAMHHHPRLRAGVGAVIDRRERGLRPGSRIHGVEVGDEGLHRLVGLTTRLLDSLATDSVGDPVGVVDEPGEQFRHLLLLMGQRGAIRLQHPPGGRLAHLVEILLVTTEDLEGPRQTGLGGLDEGLGYPRRHVSVKVRHRLATVLVILVGLDRNAGQGRIRPDRLRGSQHAVAGGEAVLDNRWSSG